jgi:O-methyltransferase involved in polyketide biosynthesis
MKVPPVFNSGVSSTMLITLWARAQESISEDPIIDDRKAVEMIEIIKTQISGTDDPIHRKILGNKYNPKLAVTMSLRSRRFDRYVTDFLTRSPGGTVINLGCGLDTRFYRIDNGRVTWYDIDFPDVIELRKRFMEENDRHFFIGDSILNRDWIARVRSGGPYLILAEGVFMYLSDKDVKELLSMIKSELNTAELVCEVTNSYWVDKMNNPWLKRKFNRKLGMTGGAVFSFGIPDSYYFEKWDRDFKFLDEWTYFDDNERKLGWYNLFSSFSLLRKAQWTVHYKVTSQNHPV